MSVGVQYRGPLNRREEAHLFSWGWPQDWHVIWHIVPISPRAGNPQIEWDVETERSSNDHVTYWVKVKNLTDFDMQFEMRYAILN